MADIFREVDEELRRDAAAKLWKKYGFAVIGLAVAIVLAVAGLQGWRAYDLDRRSGQSDWFAEALDAAAKGDGDAALVTLRGLSDPSADGYAALAAFEEARLLADAGDTAGAIAIWDRIAENGALGAELQTAALLLSVLHQVDTGDPQPLRQRLEPLTAPDQAYRAAALELSALIALRQGERAAARDLYQLVADDGNAPAGARARATQMIAALKG